MHQMGNIGNGLQRDLGAVEGAAAGRGAGLELLGAAFLPVFSDLLRSCRNPAR